jgi:sec-independent protein translocase protein TatA
MYTGTLLEFLNMGGGEIMLILVAVLLLFGGKKLPELARGLGKGIRDFKDASEGVKREIHRNINAVDIVDDVKSTFNDTLSSTNTYSSTSSNTETTTEPVSETNSRVAGTTEPDSETNARVAGTTEQTELEKNNI